MRPRHLWMGVVMVLVSVSVGWTAPQQTTALTGTSAQGRHLITFKGVLKDADGNPRAGAMAMTFTLYAAQQGGEALWVESQAVQADGAGRYTVLLGSTSATGLPAEAFGDGKAQWLAVQVEGEAEQPRVLLVAVPYALKAADADTLGGKPVASFVLTENLAKAVETQMTATVSAQPLAAPGGGTVAPLGNESGSTTNYGQYSGTGGSWNSFFGQSAGNQTSGMGNTLLGASAGETNTTGAYNTFVGRSAGGYSTTGYSNTAVGAYAGRGNTQGLENTALGYAAGTNNTTGTGNVFVGTGAGWTNTTASHNMFIGASSDAATGLTNAAAIGYLAYVGRSNSMVLGSIAGVNGATADTNVGIGTTAPGSMLDVRGEIGTGDGLIKNVVSYARYEGNPVGVFGTMSGHDLQLWANGSPQMSVTTGGLVGVGTRAPVSALDVRGAVTSGDGTLKNVISYAAPGGPLVGVLGTLSRHDLQVWANGSSQMAVTAAGNVGIGTTSPQYKLHVFGSIYATGSYLGSDRRLKRDVQDLRYGLREVLRLRPVSFGWKDPALGSTTMGLIAQEAEPIVPELVARAQDEDGMLSLNYVGLVPVLIKAVQEQQAQKDAETAALKAENHALKIEMARLTAQDVAREARLAALEEQLQQLLAREERDNR